MANPLKQYFRQPALFLKLPTLGKWYTNNEITSNEDKEIPIFGLSAVDDVMLSTPDAMLNGVALENVIKNCAPDVKNVKKLMVPDIEGIFLGIKIATTGSKYDLDRICPKCQHENTFEVNCEHLMGTMTCIEESDTVINLNNELEIHVRPYTLEMRQLFIHKQFEEDRLLKTIDSSNKNLDEFEKAEILAKSIEKITRITFDLVSKSIESIKLLKQGGQPVIDPADISEWLVNISKTQADIIIDAVNKLNEIGINKVVAAECEKCHHKWNDTLNFDPTSFFGKR
jgi:hypothetical protein